MAPPVWRIEINKSFPGEEWANDYLTKSTTIEDAQDLASILLDFERSIHMSAVQFNYMRISSWIKGDRTFRHLAINLAGQATTVEYLPLYCTMRLDLPTANSDPARKYYRLPVGEGAQANGVFNSASIDAWTAAVNTHLVANDAIPLIVTSKGNPCTTANVFPYVQMRQLHRRRKKKAPAV